MNFLFTCRPMLGHFQPLLSLAEAARTRGHSVAFATGEPIATQARAAGFDCFVAGLSLSDSLARLAQTGDRHAQVAAPRDTPFRLRPLVFADRSAFAARRSRRGLFGLPARRCRARGCGIGRTLGGDPGGYPLGDRGLWPPASAGSSPPSRGRALRRSGAKKGLAVPSQAGLYKHMYVDPYPQLLQIKQIEELPSVIRLRPAAGPKQARIRLERRIVYVTFGTAWNSGPTAVERFRAALTGSADAADEAIATVGSDVDPAILDPLPANVEIHRFVPQDELLPRCACVVAHGGSGTVLGALAWGKPLLLLPQFADQFYNAERALDAGVALVLAPGEVTRAAVLERVRRLLNDASFSECAVQAQGELAAMPDVEAVLDRIEELLRSSGTARVSLTQPHAGRG